MTVTLARTLSAIALAGFVGVPLIAQDQPVPAAQEQDRVQGSIKSWMSEAPDPGFAHNQNQGGRSLTQNGSVPDYGNYCGPLPSHICNGYGYNFVLNNDPFAPAYWRNHSGNAAAFARSQQKGWPLQTVIVLAANGAPVANAEVRFFETGYRNAGIRGVTDSDGQFQVAVKKIKRSHRFVIEQPGFKKARLDIVGKQIHTASHRIVLNEYGPATQAHQVALMGDVTVPADLSKDYRRAEKALDAGNWSVAIAELKALVERWPVGTLVDGEYQPRALLILALTGAGETSLAEKVEQHPVEVIKVDTAG